MVKIPVRDENFKPVHKDGKHYIVHKGKVWGRIFETNDIESADLMLYTLFELLEKNRNI